MPNLRLLGLAIAAFLIASPANADDDHPKLTGAVKAFHDTLSPNWHSAPGSARNAAACRNADRYTTSAKAIVEQAAPAKSDRNAGPQAAAALHDASVALGAYCASGHDANVVAGLTILHDRFHDLTKAMRLAAAHPPTK